MDCADEAINPLVNKLGIKSSIVTTFECANYDKNIGRAGWMKFLNENGCLNNKHPINGRKESE
jgi:hypothetical protein